ncbi:MAG: DUF4330 domain-containing protein [Candidatus Gastranaerophilales bacterium]|nr:DUF4330 domain-containing protein [Candidatus Gastranaerophilales bacterium]
MNILKKLKPFDYCIIVIIIFALIVGFLTFKGKRATSSNQIEASVNIELEVYLRGVTTTDSEPLFKTGDETFITIRNVPYTKLKIKEVKYDKKKALVPSINPKKPYIVVNDETVPNQYDYLVKVTDSAKITKDGDAVVGGNKVKIGIPITLEGAKYKLNGVISNVSINSEQLNNIHEDLDKHTQLNQDVH